MKKHITPEKILQKLVKIKIRSRYLFYEIIDKQLPVPGSMVCPICEFIDSTSSFRIYESRCIFGGGKLIRHECPNCGLIFGTQRMLSLSDRELDREYAEHYSCYNEGDSTESELKAFEYLQPKPEGIYLNFGCGRWSSTIEQARLRGYQLFGFDPYTERANDDYIINNINVLKAMKFDGIMSNDVLEHLRYPHQTLLFMASLLKDNGLMVHKTPCYSYSYEYTRFHLYFFTGNSLSNICQMANLALFNTDKNDIKILKKNN